MVININSHLYETDEHQGNIILSDTSETGTDAVKNIVVLTQAEYDALSPNYNSTTLYFIT